MAEKIFATFRREFEGLMTVQKITKTFLFFLLFALATGCGTAPDNSDDGGSLVTPDAAATGALDTGPPITPGPKRMFVTSGRYNGQIERDGTPPGIQSADSICGLHAETAGLGGNWIAYLGDANTSAISRIRGEGPWLNMRGETVFGNRANLEVSPPAAEMAYMEDGSAFGVVNISWWTGASETGTRTTTHCDQWTAVEVYSWTNSWGEVFYDSLEASYGESHRSARGWSNVGERLCQDMLPLLCFEN